MAKSPSPASSSAARSTIYDVAERAGVAISTVSRVLNNSDDVSSATRERVLEAIQELQFSPNRTAKALAQRQIVTLAIAIPTFTTPFHNELLKGVRSGLRDIEVDLLVRDLAWAKPEKTLHDFLQRGAVDGLLLVGLPLNERLAADLEAMGAPTVLIGQHYEGFDAFYWDEATGARMGVGHLIERGHTRVGMITAPFQSDLRDARIRGYREALEAAGLGYDENLICYGHTKKHAGFSEEAGYEAMQELLTIEPPVTAVFASSDVQALGAWKAIRESGRSVPADIALIGYDDIKTSRYVGLTTVAQQMHDVGEDSAALLLRRVRGVEDRPPTGTLIQPILKVRAST